VTAETGLSIGAGVATFLALGFAGLYLILSAFAQALESLSAIRRKALLEAHPQRFGQLLAPEQVRVSRIAVRLSAQAAVLGGLLSLGTALAAWSVPDPYLVAAVAILLGWLLLEGIVIRRVSQRGPDTMLEASSWLVPMVLVFAAPLYPLLSWLVEREPEETGADSSGAVASQPEKEEATKDAEVRALLDVAREEGIIEQHEEELVSRAVDFGHRTVREVMTPRPDITIVQADAPFAEVADLFVKTKYTRIPLVDGTIDRPVGIVHVKDVFTALRSSEPPSTARGLARPVLFAPESQTVHTLLSDFQRRRQPLAIVVDEYGSVTGLVTLEDLVEELVGEIADEHEDELPPVVALAAGGYSMAGRVRVDELATLFGTFFPEAEYDTVAGLVSAKLGHIPRPGETVEESGLVFLVEEADRRRIYRVRVARQSASKEAGS
jgi:CBS domain containing-hemolysin-like protein